MLTCSNCGASVREGARFCTTCGTRLNDPVASDATSVWAAPATGQPATSSDEATVDESTSSTESTWSGDTSDQHDARVDAAPEPEAGEDARVDAAPEANTDTDSDADAPSEPPPQSDEGFTWSWGTSSNADDVVTPQAVDEVDEESGVVLEDAQDQDPDTSEPVDATEIEILEVEETTSGSGNDAAEPAPDTSDTMLVVEDDEHDGQDESETLAAWAEQWESPEVEDVAIVNDPDSDPTRGESETLDQAGTSEAGDVDSGGEEDTVARAERLIGELRAIIPTLARPLPAPPANALNNLPDPLPLAEELEVAARAGQFDDLREALQAARERPRDVDSMLTLSSKVDRLLELLDDRDNLAQTAERAATRLRPGTGATEE